VLFDRGKEIARIDGMLKTYYFQEVLRYVGERHYEQYPQLRDYLAARTQAILQSGENIDIWK
jgi:thioredoxin-related protein